MAAVQLAARIQATIHRAAGVLYTRDVLSATTDASPERALSQIPGDAARNAMLDAHLRWDDDGDLRLVAQLRVWSIDPSAGSPLPHKAKQFISQIT